MAKKKADKKKQKGTKEPPPEEQGPRLEDRVAEFSSRYKWLFIVPIAVLAIVTIAVAVVSGQKRSQRKAALQEFRSAKTADGYEAVAEQYPATIPGKQALVRAGDLLYNEGKYAEARANYEAYLATDPHPILAIPVRTDVVQTYIREKNYEAALKECNAILAAEGRQFAERQARYYAGYCSEKLGRTKEAREWYQKLTEIPEGRQLDRSIYMQPWRQMAQRRLSELPPARGSSPSGRARSPLGSTLTLPGQR